MVVPENARSPPALHRGSLGQRLAGPGHARPVPVSAPAQIPRANVRCRVSLSVRAEAGPAPQSVLSLALSPRPVVPLPLSHRRPVPCPW